MMLKQRKESIIVQIVPMTMRYPHTIVFDSVGSNIGAVAKGNDNMQDIFIVKKYDSEYPQENIPLFLDYYELTKEQFDDVLDRHANKKLFKKENGICEPFLRVKDEKRIRIAEP